MRFILRKLIAKVDWQMANLGYARVSTNGQDLTGQVAELQAARCVKIYREKASGAKTDRPELAKLLRALEPGDVLIVTRLDRLARSTRDLLNVLDAVAKAKAGFRSLKDTWADTTTPHGRLMLTVLGGLAEFERELIRARTGEGRSRAKARGVRFWPSPAAGGYPAPHRGRYAGRSAARPLSRAQASPGEARPSPDRRLTRGEPHRIALGSRQLAVS
jgi:DNA invertase Pin-like site-specific DNA recombinase